jgi:hypothetical protein
VKRSVTVTLGVFSLEALEGAESGGGASQDRLLMQAIRYYLADRESGRAGWPYPDLARDGETGSKVRVKIAIDDSVWRQFSDEADHQGVSTDQLLQHAALYFAADRDAGRLTQRILASLEEMEG